jgi:preprotein translocase subunit SecD
LLGKTAKLEFKLVDLTADPAAVAQGRAPAGSQIIALSRKSGRRSGAGGQAPRDHFGRRSDQRAAQP